MYVHADVLLKYSNIEVATYEVNDYSYWEKAKLYYIANTPTLHEHQVAMSFTYMASVIVSEQFCINGVHMSNYYDQMLATLTP